MERQQTQQLQRISKEHAMQLHQNVVSAYSKFKLLNKTAIYKESFLKIRSKNKEVIGIKVKLGKIISINNNTYEGNEVHVLMEDNEENRFVVITFNAKLKLRNQIGSTPYFEYKIKSYYDYIVDEQERMAIVANTNFVN